MEGELAEKKLAVESIMDVLAPWARTTRLKKEGVWRNKYAPYPQSGEERNGTEQAKNIKLRDRMDLTKLSEYNNTMVCESLQSEFQSRAGQGRAGQGRAEQIQYSRLLACSHFYSAFLGLGLAVCRLLFIVRSKTRPVLVWTRHSTCTSHMY
jgi:hypothetical protein